MKQLLLAGAPNEGLWLLDHKTCHYLVTVRRTKPGSVLVCRDSSGRVFEARLYNQNDRWLLEEIETLGLLDSREESVSIQNRESAISFELVQALPKARKLDDIVRQATELGVAGIHLIQSDYSIADLDARWESKHERLMAIAKEACQQSNNPKLPFINKPIKTDVFVKMHVCDETNLALFFYEKNLAQSSLHSYLSGPQTRVLALIGPEGGFSKREVELFSSNGYYSVSLGSNILRTETAAIAALSLLSVLSRERSDWILREL